MADIRPRPRVDPSLVLVFVVALVGFAPRNQPGPSRDQAEPGDGVIGRLDARGDSAPVAPQGEPKGEPLPPRVVINSIGMRLTWIDAGEFLMGSDAADADAYDNEFVDVAAGRKEKHRVRITRPFYLGIYEVTRGQFRRFVDDSGYKTEADRDGKGGWGWNEDAKTFETNPRYNWLNPGFAQTDEHPVVNVSRNDAQALIAWLSRREGRTYRLPTEAEWEYACRAGSTSRFSFGDDPQGLAAVGNVADATAEERFPAWKSCIAAHDGFAFTAPVGRFKPNAWGLFDMHDNVWEWCADGYAATYYEQSPVDDPPGTGLAAPGVYRGCGYYDHPGYARSAVRYPRPPQFRSNVVGFRLALVPDHPG